MPAEFPSFNSKTESEKPVTFSTATAADLPKLGEFIHNSWMETYATNPNISVGTEEVEGMNLKAVFNDAFARKLENGLRRVWLAKDGENIVGSCNAKNETGHAIGSLYVKQGYERQGIGGKLLQEAINWLGREDPIYLGVFKGNENARQFFVSQGFIELAGPEEYDKFDATDKRVEAFDMVLPPQTS